MREDDVKADKPSTVVFELTEFFFLKLSEEYLVPVVWCNLINTFLSLVFFMDFWLPVDYFTIIITLSLRGLRGLLRSCCFGRMRRILSVLLRLNKVRDVLFFHLTKVRLVQNTIFQLHTISRLQFPRC